LPRNDASRGLSQLATLIAAIIVVATLYFARIVFVPFALAVLFAFLLTPIVRLLDRIHLPRAVSSVVVVTCSVFALGLLGWVVAGQLIEVADQLPGNRTNIKLKIESLHGSKNQSINKAAAAVKEIGNELAESNPSSGAPASPITPKGLAAGTSAKPIAVEMVPPASNPLESLNSLVGPVSIFGIVTVFTLFMLIRREDLRNRFIRLFGHAHLNLMTQALDDASSRVSRYLFLQLSVNVGFGVIVGMGLYCIGVPQALLWGVVAALLRFLPYVGSLLAAVLPILLSLAMFDGWTHTLLTLALYATTELLVANLVEPLLFGAQVGLSSLAILVAAVFWAVLWGPIGLVLSTPLTVCLVVIGRYVPNLGFLNILLGDEPVLAPESHFYQRLLASDQHEAKWVLESYLQDHSLQQLYDSVVIPALALAEQDRHRNNLDETTQQFITLSTRELIEELGDRAIEGNARESQKLEKKNGADETPGAARESSRDVPSPRRVICLPARDDADEIVGTMLAQLLEHAGHRAQCLPTGTAAEIIAAVERAGPEIVCISALPPFVISHARNLYKRLRERSPTFKILIGFWGFSVDTASIAKRMHLAEDDRILNSLAEVIAEMKEEVEAPESPDGGDQESPTVIHDSIANA
jgi:predicted PurR-regulated permease PerM/methanogenic corrinoid protein MtbC1